MSDLNFFLSADDIFALNSLPDELYPTYPGIGVLSGSPGLAATIQIGTVLSGTSASVVNVGTSTSAILNFTLPVLTFEESDPIFSASPAHTITSAEINQWNSNPKNLQDIENLLNVTSGNIQSLSNLSGVNTGDQILPTLSGLGGVPITRNINNKSLSADINLTYLDVNADPSGAATSAAATITLSSLGGLPVGTTLDNISDGTIRKLSNYLLSSGFSKSSVESLLGITDIQVTAITNLSGVNTGDQILPTLSGLGGVPITRNINNKSLSADIILSATDIINSENIINKVTTITSGSTDTQYPSAKLLYSQVVSLTNLINNLLNSNGALTFQGVLDCSSNPNYPPASVGWVWKLSPGGKIGGSSGHVCKNLDLLICITNSVGGIESDVGSNFSVVRTNIDGAVIGPSSSTTGNFCYFTDGSGTLISDSGYNSSTFESAGTASSLITSLNLAATYLGILSQATDSAKLGGQLPSYYQTAHTPITGATYTKITYGTDGIITSGSNTTTSDIADSLNKRYCTDAEKTAIDSLGTASTYAAGAFDTSGSASTVQSNLTTHSNLTTSAHGGLVSSGDSRLTDTRTPTDGTVTDVKVASGAAIAWSKINKTGAVAGDVGAVPTSRQINNHSLSADITLTCDDISDGTNTHLLTTAQKTIMGNTSGTNTGNETANTIGTLINGATDKSTLVSGDCIAISDISASNILKHITYGEFTTLLNSLYSPAGAKTWTRTSITTSASPVPVGSSQDNYFEITALSAGTTFGIPSGSPITGNELLIAILDNGGAQTLGWNIIFKAGTNLPLPTTTVAGKPMFLKFIYFGTNWYLLAQDPAGF